MRGSKPDRPTLWILLLTLVASQSAFAQTVVRRISGTVQDSMAREFPTHRSKSSTPPTIRNAR